MITLDMIFNKWQRLQERRSYQSSINWPDPGTPQEPDKDGGTDTPVNKMDDRLNALKALPSLKRKGGRP